MTHLLITRWMAETEKGSRIAIFSPSRIAAKSRYNVDWF